MTGPVLAYASTWGEVGASFVSAAVSIALVSVVWFTLAPLLGLTSAGKAPQFCPEWSTPVLRGSYRDNVLVGIIIMLTPALSVHGSYPYAIETEQKARNAQGLVKNHVFPKPYLIKSKKIFFKLLYRNV